MQRYFAEKLNGSYIVLSEEDLHHLYHVMRYHSKERIIGLYDGKTYLCMIEDEQGKIKVIQEIEEDHELDVDVTLVYALPKGDKLDWVVQKACELGASRIVPYLSKRSIIKTDPLKFEKKRIRLNRIVKEAAEQSTRTLVPEITGLCLPSQLKNYLSDINLVAYEESSRQHEHIALSRSLKSLKERGSVTIIVGPEGGFDEEEIVMMKDLGIIPCSLGKRILRSETAPLYMLSVIGYIRELEN